MEKNAHKGFSFAGSVVLSSAIYHFAPHIASSQPVNTVLSSVGKPYTYTEVLAGFPGMNPELLAGKIIFFAIVVIFASFPDRIEKRASGVIEGHRGFSHSLLFLFFLFTGYLFVDWIVGAWLHGYYHFYLPELFQHAIGAAFLGLFSTTLWHVVADMCTRQGVKFFWPDNTAIGWPPFKELRPTNTDLFAHVILWVFIGVVSALFVKGIVGI